MNQIYYKSTRGNEVEVTAAEAIVQGLCTDGGLFAPTTVPKLTSELKELI